MFYNCLPTDPDLTTSNNFAYINKALRAYLKSISEIRISNADLKCASEIRTYKNLKIMSNFGNPYRNA